MKISILALALLDAGAMAMTMPEKPSAVSRPMPVAHSVVNSVSRALNEAVMTVLPTPEVSAQPVLEKRHPSRHRQCAWGMKVCKLNRPHISADECQELLSEAWGGCKGDFELLIADTNYDDIATGFNDLEDAEDGESDEIEKRGAIFKRNNRSCKKSIGYCVRWTGQASTDCESILFEAGICPGTPSIITDQPKEEKTSVYKVTTTLPEGFRPYSSQS